MCVYTMAEAAKILRINVSKMHELRRAGLVKCFKLGQYKVSEVELNRFIDESTGKDVSDPWNVVDLQGAAH